jgi:hypothetical protein
VIALNAFLLTIMPERRHEHHLLAVGARPVLLEPQANTHEAMTMATRISVPADFSTNRGERGAELLTRQDVISRPNIWSKRDAAWALREPEDGPRHYTTQLP